MIDIAQSKTFYTLKKFLPYFLNFKIRMIAALFALVSAKAAVVAVPIVFKNLIDFFSADGALNQSSQIWFSSQIELLTYPIMLITVYSVLRLLSTFFVELRELIFVKVTYSALTEISLKVFNNLHKLSLNFHLSKKTGALTRELERGTRGIGTIVNFTLYSVLPTFFEVIFVALWLTIHYEILFAIIIFFALFTYAIFTIYVTNWRMILRRSMNNADTDANATVVDSLMNYETVKYFNNESFEERRYKTKLLLWKEKAEKSQSSLAVLNLGQAVIISIASFCILALAAVQFEQGIMTIGDLVLINAFLVQLFLPLNFLGVLYREIKQALIDIEKLFFLIEKKSEILDKKKAKPISSSKELMFKNVFFSYGSRKILKNFNLLLQPNTSTALVGHSGAGKSTISKLIYRFYDVDSGSIMIDETDIRDLKQKDLRKLISVVPQDPVLFNETIEFNIKYGNPNCKDEELRRSIESAELSHFIKALPNGLKTIVGERGLKLSGGEKQRVAIARALLKRPSIIIFDEATSSLDSKTEKQIQNAINNITKKMTCLIIAHRLSTIISVDEIVVIDSGMIVQQGKHSELISRSGKYLELWRSQGEGNN